MKSCQQHHNSFRLKESVNIFPRVTGKIDKPFILIDKPFILIDKPLRYAGSTKILFNAAIFLAVTPHWNLLFRHNGYQIKGPL